MSNLIKKTKYYINNLFFCIAVVIGAVLALISAAFNIRLYFDSVPESEDLLHNMLTPISSVYTFWLGSGKQNFFSIALFWMIPVLSVLPVLNHCRTNKRTVDKHNKSITEYLTDYFSTFIAAGLAAAIPLLLNFWCMLLFVPAHMPDSVYEIYYGVFSYYPFSDLFYAYPVLYELLYIAFFFVIGGLIGGTANTLLMMFHNKVFAVFIVPAIIIFLQLDYLYIGVLNTNISLISFFYSHTDMSEHSKAIIIESALMFIFSIINIMKHVRKREET